MNNCKSIKPFGLIKDLYNYPPVDQYEIISIFNASYFSKPLHEYHGMTSMWLWEI